MKRHLISALVTGLSAVLASLSTLLLNIDWATFQNPEEVFIGVSTALSISIRGGVKVFIESFIASFKSE